MLRSVQWELGFMSLRLCPLFLTTPLDHQEQLLQSNQRQNETFVIQSHLNEVHRVALNKPTCLWGILMKPAYGVWGLILLLIIAHQDIWFWEDTTLVFGFLPIALAYHAGISLAAAFTWYLATQFCWPTDQEPSIQRKETP
jgi:hypothetical protein